jgi:outer membrane protein assembly factor BamB
MLRVPSVIARRFALLFGTSLLAACSTWNPFADPPRIKPVELPEFSASVQAAPLWQASLGAKPAGAPALVLNGSSLSILVAAGNAVQVFEAASGRRSAIADSGGPLASGASSDGSLIAAATRSGEIVVWDSTGVQKWRVTLNAEVLATPVITDGVVAALTTDGRLVGFDADSGKRRWVVQRAAPPLSLRLASPLIAVKGGFIVGLPGGRLMAVSSRDGQVRWESQFALPRGSNEVERISDIAPAVSALSGDLCLSSYQGKIGCVSLRDGRATWQKDFSSPVGVGSSLTEVYGTDEKAHVSAFSSTGNLVWKNDKLTWRGLTAPVVSGGMVVVGDFKGYVHFIAAASGVLSGRASTDGSAIVAAPLAYESGGQRVVVVATSNGALYAYTQQ